MAEIVIDQSFLLGVGFLVVVFAVGSLVIRLAQREIRKFRGNWRE